MIWRIPSMHDQEEAEILEVFQIRTEWTRGTQRNE